MEAILAGLGSLRSCCCFLSCKEYIQPFQIYLKFLDCKELLKPESGSLTPKLESLRPKPPTLLVAISAVHPCPRSEHVLRRSDVPQQTLLLHSGPNVSRFKALGTNRNGNHINGPSRTAESGFMRLGTQGSRKELAYEPRGSPEQCCNTHAVSRTGYFPLSRRTPEPQTP